MSDLSYTIYEPRQPRDDLVARADELVFIKEGFSFWAMVGSVFWMVYHHLWLPLIGFVIALLALISLAHQFGASPDAGGVLFFGLSVAFGFLANDIRRMVLMRNQYRLVGAIAGQSKIDCERRFFRDWSPLLSSLHSEAKR